LDVWDFNVGFAKPWAPQQLTFVVPLVLVGCFFDFPVVSLVC